MPHSGAPIKRRGAILGRINASPKQSAKDFLPPASVEAVAMRPREGGDNPTRRAGRVDQKARKTGRGQVSYKDILVYLDAGKDASDRLRLAVELAKTHDARLIGVDASDESALVGAWGDRALHIRPAFEAAVKDADVVGHFIGADAEPALGSDFAHCVDLIVAPRPEGDARRLVREEVPDRVLIEAGGPILILPQDWAYGPLGKNVVIAWNASREAARAVHDAMPLLKNAHKVTIFSFSSRAHEFRASAERLADHLARHGVAAHISDWTDTGDVSALEALFASLDTQDADLIVAGAFSHSRLFESLFGGVSLDLLRQPTAPIFMSH
jgi:nucleotide-binding universal stress UspA family protein